MFVLIRALTYAVIFVGLLLIYVPAQLLSSVGIARPVTFALPQFAGMIIAAGGALLAAWCVWSFANIGKGTPAPFDAPRRLVVQGPYQYLRNPMYLGATLALAGAALFYGSLQLLGYAALFVLIAHAFVLLYEEPTLRRTYGDQYRDYCRRVRRWLPSRPG